MPKVVALISSGRYKQEHYEDVAELMRRANRVEPRATSPLNYEPLVRDFADLFAADNPRRCFADKDHAGDCDDGCLTGEGPSNEGFDRARFLAACGLESER